MSTYLEDEPVRLGVAGSGAPEWLLEVPVTLFARMTIVGTAYQLPVVGAIDARGETRLDRPRCEALIAELEFVLSLLDDPLMHAVVERIQDVVAEAARTM